MKKMMTVNLVMLPMSCLGTVSTRQNSVLRYFFLVAARSISHKTSFYISLEAQIFYRLLLASCTPHQNRSLSRPDFFTTSSIFHDHEGGRMIICEVIIIMIIMMTIIVMITITITFTVAGGIRPSDSILKRKIKLMAIAASETMKITFT